MDLAEGKPEKPSRQLKSLEQLPGYLQLHYAFRYNQLTDRTECPCLLSAAQIYTALKSQHPAALQDCTPLAFSKLFAQGAYHAWQWILSKSGEIAGCASYI